MKTYNQIYIYIYIYISLRGWDASCCVIIIGNEVKQSVATVCVCALLLHVEHYNKFRQ
jgi:hypothetical protein